MITSTVANMYAVVRSFGSVNELEEPSNMLSSGIYDNGNISYSEMSAKIL